MTPLQRIIFHNVRVRLFVQLPTFALYWLLDR